MPDLYQSLYSIICLSASLPETSLMLKAPFRFDIEYFSIIMIYRSMPVMTAQPRFSTPSRRQSVSIKNQPQSQSAQPCLLLFITNTNTDHISAGLNRDQDIPPSLTSLFPSVYDIFKHIKHNRDTDDIKVSIKGNLIINHEGQRIKLNTQPLPFEMNDFEELWAMVKEDWDHRNVANYQEQGFIYSQKIASSTIVHTRSDNQDRRPADNQEQKSSDEPHIEVEERHHNNLSTTVTSSNPIIGTGRGKGAPRKSKTKVTKRNPLVEPPNQNESESEVEEIDVGTYCQPREAKIEQVSQQPKRQQWQSLLHKEMQEVKQSISSLQQGRIEDKKEIVNLIKSSFDILLTMLKKSQQKPTCHTSAQCDPQPDPSQSSSEQLSPPPKSDVKTKLDNSWKNLARLGKTSSQKGKKSSKKPTVKKQKEALQKLQALEETIVPVTKKHTAKRISKYTLGDE